MRYNAFREPYCDNASEVSHLLDEHVNGWEVYAGNFTPKEGKMKPSVEILENESGDLVCYIEAESKADLVKILTTLRIERSDDDDAS